MKKEASGKKGKLWLWIVIAVVLIAAIGVGLFFLLSGGEEKADDGMPDLYWNVDREASTDRDTGLSIRQPAEDGNYYIRFAHNGEQVEIPVADKKLVNYIDSLDLMGLSLDENGFILDIFPVKDIASVIGESLYVQSVSGDTIIANSSIMMNGRKITVKLNDDLAIYNVSGKGEFVGEKLDASKLNPMDTISIYGTLVAEDSEEEPVPTHIYVLNKPVESKIYFRADVFYDSTNKVTTREPDENGAYTIKWYCEGETVELKCKDKDMVSTIDSSNYHWCHWGLEFDEEGYIIDIIDSFLGSRTLMQCERYDITEVGEDGSYTATSLIKNNGAFVQGVVGADCPIYDISSTAKAEGQDNRKVDSLQLGDRVCIWTDTMGNPVQIYVTRRAADSVGYWVVTRSYSSATGLTTRTPNANGYYEIELLKAGDTKNTIYYTKDVNVATAVDKTADRCVGLKVGEGNIIEAVYDIEAVFGYTYLVRGYYVQDSTGSVVTLLSPSGSGYTRNGVLAEGAQAWNVSTVGKYGEQVDLQVDDYIYAGKTPIGEIAYAYVLRRVLEGGDKMFYWRLDSRQYDTTNKVTTRVPDADGYYSYLFAHEGQQVTLRTNNKEFANALDYQSSAPAFTLEVKGDIITKVHEGTYAYGGTRYNGWTVKAVNGNELSVVNSTGTTEDTWIVTDETKIFNVSNSFFSHKGEKISKIKVGDVLANYRDTTCAARVLIVKSRETNKMAFPVNPQYNSEVGTLRTANEKGWYTVDLAVDGKIRTYVVKSKAVMDAIDEYTSPFGIEVSGDEILYMSTTTYVENVKGSGVNTYTVQSASGSSVKVIYTLGHSENTGTTQDLTLSSDVKIYDVSADAKAAGKFGGSVKLKKGDVIRTYKDTEDNHLYVYVLAHNTREIKSYCAHCDKVVYWTPYIPSSNVVAFDSHYYLATDLELSSQMRIYSTARDFETVLDLNGKTMNRVGGRLGLIRYGDTLTIIDTSADKTGKVMTTDNTSNGGVFMVSAAKSTGTGVLNLGAKVGDKVIWGGTITLSEKNEKYSEDGGLITNSGTVNIYDALLTGGIAWAKDSDGASGGAINSSGTINMFGGEISGNMAVGAFVNEADELKTYTGGGGNISSSGTVNIYGGVIKDGIASRGGNVFVEGGTFTLHNGTIENGTAALELPVQVTDLATNESVIVMLPLGKSTDSRGGNIFSNGDVFIRGGIVKDGKVVGKDYGGNIMSTGLSDTLYIMGGTVTGGTYQKNWESDPALSAIQLMYSNVEISGGVVDGGALTGTVVTSTGTNTGGFSTITVSGGTVKGNIAGGGSAITILTDEEGKEYYLSSGTPYYIGYNEDGSAYYITSSGKHSKLYPNYRTVFNLTGGKVEGIVNAGTSQEINVSGNPVLNELKIGGTLLNVGEMTSGAEINISTIGVFSKPVNKAASYTGYFKPTTEGFIVGVTDNKELKVVHPNAVAGPCDHCGGANADWMPWNGSGDAAGHYFLENDMTLEEAAEIATGLEVVIDLRGYTITAAEDSRNFYVNGDLVVMDTSEAKTGLITGGKATRGGNVYVTDKGSFTLLSGTVANGVADNALGTSTTNGRGGNIFANGNVNILGGAVIDGSTVGGSNMGGNIMMTGRSAVLTVDGDAVISGGKIGSSKNNIYLMYSNLVVDGGKITNGGIGNNGTGSGGYCTITINGGIVDDPITLGGNTVAEGFDYLDYRTALTITGGTVAKIDASKAFGGKVVVSGKPVVNNLALGDDILLDATGIEAGADIKLAATGVFSTAFADKASAEAAADCISVAGKVIVVTEANELAVEAPPVIDVDKYCAHCDQTVTFSVWDGSVSTGHFYLLTDMDVSSSASVGSGKDFVLDLNGKTITANGCRAFYVSGGATLSILDTVGGGVITGGNSGTGRGGNVYASGGNLKLYGGSIINGTAPCDGNQEGHNVAVYNGLFYMNGDVVIGDTDKEGHSLYLFSSNPTQLIKGTIVGKMLVRTADFELKKDVSIDTLALRGTALTAVEERDSSNKIAIKITTGDNSFLTGEFTSALTNAAAAAEYFTSAKSGTEIIVNANGKLEVVTGGSVTPPPVEPEGDTKTIFCQHCQQEVAFAKLVLDTNGAGDAHTIGTGHYFLNQDMEVSLPIAIGSDKDVVVDLNGKTLTANGCRAFYISGGATLTVQDAAGNGVITGGNSNGGRGGNIYATGANVKLYGGKIYGGTAATGNSAGNDVAVYNGQFIVDGNVEIGQAYEDAYYAVFVFSPTALELNNGSITGGILARSYNDFVVKSGMAIDMIGLWGSSIKSVEARTGAKIAVMLTNSSNAKNAGVFTAVLDNAADAAAYFKAAMAGYTVVANADGALEIVEGGDPETPETTLCPHCLTEVTWTEWAGQTESGHYYLAEDKVLTAEYDLTGSVDVVIDLRGNDITGEGVAHVFDIRDSAVLSVCDTVGGGIISGANNTEGSGGNVYVYNDAVFNLYGGTIANGHALKRGGNIYITSASANIYGGSVIDGTVDEIFSDADPRMLGGNIFVMNGNLSVSGDAVISNTTDGFGEAIYLRGNATPCEFVVTGGTINGEIVLHENFAKAEFSGKVVASEITVRTATKQALITKLGAFEAGASVKFNAINIPFTVADALVSEADLAYIGTVDSKYVVVKNADNKLEVVEACACGCGVPASEVVWVDANAFFAARGEGYAEMPAETDPEKAEKALRRTLNEDIHLRLSADLDITALYGAKAQIVQDPTETGCNVTIDLNGFTWSSNHRYYVYKNSVLTIIDSSAEGTGVMSSTGYNAGSSGGIIANYGTLNIYGGTFTQPAGSGIPNKGGLIYQSSGVFNFYGGTITGGQATVKNDTTSGMGGNIYIRRGEFNMYGGLITGGNALGETGVGGNVYIESSADTTFNMYGGQIVDGVAAESADLFVGESAIYNNEGGIVGEAPALCACGCGAVASEVEWIDANAYFAEQGAGYTELTDAAVKKTKRQLTTDMHLKLTADLNIADLYGTVMQIEVGNSTTPVKVTLDLNGYVWTSVGQRGIYVETGSELTIMDSSIAKTGKLLATGKSGSAGRAVANYGTVNLLSGTLGMAADPIDVTNGGVVYQSKGVFNMYGGTICGGNATNGGNLNIYRGELNVFGGEIKDGTAENGANIYLNTGVTYVKEGGTISDEATSVYQKPAA
ncbi:MAG: hypothetical protein IKA47_12135 [Oscillospiraceae bacterium]|nr:hypothetical protein [Oscillospiraceae bacterium]